MKWIAEFTVPPDDRDGLVGIKFEDSGQAAIMYHPVEDAMTVLEGDDGQFFVRLHSWDDTAPPRHTRFREFMGKRVRVTVETL